MAYKDFLFLASSSSLSIPVFILRLCIVSFGIVILLLDLLHEHFYLEQACILLPILILLYNVIQSRLAIFAGDYRC